MHALLQVSSEIDVLPALAKALSSNLSGADVSLKGRTVGLKKAGLLQGWRLSSKPSVAEEAKHATWRSVKMWPSQVRKAPFRRCAVHAVTCTAGACFQTRG